MFHAFKELCRYIFNHDINDSLCLESANFVKSILNSPNIFHINIIIILSVTNIQNVSKNVQHPNWRYYILYYIYYYYYIL